MTLFSSSRLFYDFLWGGYSLIWVSYLGAPLFGFFQVILYSFSCTRGHDVDLFSI